MLLSLKRETAERVANITKLLAALRVLRKDVSMRINASRQLLIDFHNEKTSNIPLGFLIGHYVVVCTAIRMSDKLSVLWSGHEDELPDVAEE